MNPMVRMRILLTSMALFLSFAHFAQGFGVQKGGHCYSMEVPDYMTRAYTLNDAASLQYQNLSIPAFMIVIEDEKEELQSVGMKFSGAREFLDFFVKDFKKEAAERRLGDVSEFTSNGKPHAQTEIFWKEDGGTGFFMLVTAVETPTHFYKVLCWGQMEARGRLDADFRRASKSIRE